jgi:hypothetical protein
LYQHILSPIVSFQELGNWLIRHAEHAQTIRQVEQVQEAGQLLINLPLKEYQAAGQYYLAWCDYRNDIDARETLEKIAGHAPMLYRARALQSLAAIEARKQDHEAELRWLIESMKVYPSAEALRGIAIVKAKEGFNRKALNDLESMLPLAKISRPIVFYSWLNSLATELGEAGRKNEARSISRVVLSSPFAPAYPEWQETANDLKEPNRSFVTVPLIEREYAEIKEIVSQLADEITKPAEVIPFKLKEAPEPTMPEPLTPQENRDLPLSEKRELILAAIRASEFSEFEYDKLMVSVGLLKGGPAEDMLDLEDEQLLDDIIVVWSDHIGAETLAGVLSALRDCDDSLRRNDLIDRMIRKAFQSSHLSGLTEEAWRLRVERRLPKK